jgi:hypothetical protein
LVLCGPEHEKEKAVSATVFGFAMIASVCFVIVTERFRAAFSGYIDN